jgi:hypothetical protein
MEQDRGMAMSNQARVFIQRGLGGLVFGCLFYLILFTIAKLFLNWFLPFINERYPIESPVLISAAYALAITLSMGLRIPFNSISVSMALLLTSLISGVIGMLSFLIAGRRRGVIIFLALFVLLDMAFACLTLGMILTG